MAKWEHYYLVRIQFLGFRFHGWQKQPGVKTIHGMIDKTMPFVLGKEVEFKTLGAGRTDAMVSANDFVFELFLKEPIADFYDFIALCNSNLPTDIKVKSIERTNADFNIIQTPKEKEYRYYFASGQKPHPYNAAMISCFDEDLDIICMQNAAKLFEGTHYFKRYTSKPSEKTVFEREIIHASIEANEDIFGNFIVPNSYVFKIRSKGFLRYQVRLIMGALLDVGRGKWTLQDIEESLTNKPGEQIELIAPASGLVLHETKL